MQVWGKILGAFFGFLLGGPFGLFLGLFLGHKFDKARRNVYVGGFGGFGGNRANQAERQADFFHAGFAVMGHMAKAKGRVTQEEIRVATAIMERMGLQGESRRQAQNAFREGKNDDFPLEETLQRVRQNCAGRADLLQFFLELQIQAAFADGSLHPNERQLLHVIARYLGFSEQQLEQRLHMQEAAFRFQQGGFHQQQGAGGFKAPPSKDQLAAAYDVLGVSPTASSQELKRAYRKQMNEHHPDKLAAKGLPPEMMEIAKQKTQELQAAYDLIRKEKNDK
ncbi:co-chaperone DjlA [Photobacterium sanguinicancri]|uniref:Co-chaperone protein DjlA n=1 Tax=Photobacterium sanguinicancri TaxID=875932 RepID=A0AAW7Y9E1_9GAMM|nr:co-chaperone DjlA [Photobacterium sanguinicancri]KXI21523.1 molecular chaperone DjlA [Photobacterium sanguinicancri]MDO6499832.1 co-chaperone DjlA [Photobacterium sanguinicancri]MDO6543602.1 co-chaperone DjlA [Photobacterium sanguinicancri]OZS45412.1 molecular chaperone DjlA [Photobacterium sanguinicancri]